MTEVTPSRRARAAHSLLTWIVLAGSLAGCGDKSSSGSASDALPVIVATPVTREVTLWDEYVGRFEAVNRVEVRPRVSGYLESVHFEDGQIVSEGQPLFTIDPRPFEAVLAGAQARADAAATAQRLADIELARARKLLEAKTGSEQNYEQRLQTKQAADANFSAANADVQQAQLELEFTQIKAPIAGRISREYVNKGNLVTAQSTLLTTIVSLDPIYFVFTGSERDYLNYSRLSKAGQRKSSRDAPNPVRIKLEDQDDYTVEGHMNFVDNALDPSTGTIVARAEIANPDYFLTPGMFGRLRLYGRDPFEAMLIPDKVLQFDQSRQFVWVVGKDNTAEMRPVKIGRLVDDGMRIVEEGLAPSDQVISSGFAMIRPGAKVAPRAAEPAAAAPIPEPDAPAEDKTSGSGN